ncbi:protein VACUOLELESS GAMETOPHYTES-like [Corylus avellana]|uniref:protein VACUOLELESS GAMETOPHYTES-like n=1 Tax=Corylus avellana TaxID=13451 RepID=UPI00286A34D7|nr:protein VACUOLELESS GAMETOPHYTES-like [Corylus avellana]
MGLQQFMHEHRLSLHEYVAFFGIRPHCKLCLNEIFAGSSYSCERCSFFLHKSCGKQPRTLQHLLHPQHPLLLRENPDDELCYFCNNYIHPHSGFAYNCSHCNFNIHLKCASMPLTVEAEFHDHPLKLLRKSVSFTCDACGKEDKNVSYLCITCSLMVHLRCATLPMTVKHISHRHALELTLSSQVNQSDRQICRLCVKKVETHRVYYCSKCNFVAHLDCATREGDTDATFMLEFKDKQPLESSTGMLQNKDESIDSLAYLVKKMKIGKDKIEIAEEINHFSHQHDLKLTQEEFLNNEKCDGCMLPISTSRQLYSCAQCGFFLHKSCVELPRKNRHPILHPHLLTLYTKAPYASSSFICNVCRRGGNGFTYHCKECEFDADVQCSLITDMSGMVFRLDWQEVNDGVSHRLIGIPVGKKQEGSKEG